MTRSADVSGVPRAAALGLLVVLAVLAVAASLCIGSVDIAPSRIFAILAQREHGIAATIVLRLRLPRVLAGFTVGGMLALAGALMQVLLRNPLAEPYVLGVSGGASAFSLCAMFAGLGGLWIHGAAFAGALVSILLVFALARASGEWNPMRVLLTGVVVAAGWGAVVSLLLTLSPAARVHGMLFWLMGDLSFARYSSWTAAVLLVGLGLSMLFSRGLNLLVHGDLQAAALGVRVDRLRYLVYFLASLLTAAAVTVAGSIGFVGLIVPHLIRLLLGSDHRVVLPASVLFGGTLLVAADGLARSVISPQQLPVGVLTAMIGVPLFLVLLRTTSAQQRP
jgi:iron complex transport system permease protein